ncbi:gp17 [Burkholderia phage BcepC6B]|uniref:Gp17 n=1 Tax=Burkholderia phage BcepC6B TaxID=2883949 RepID=Q6J1R0_9CAUD|nr:virion structural protein [Burkholderia phage BcepC6B]AAT38376.1 gp17 [Burkholderia phage BcepC6B]
MHQKCVNAVETAAGRKLTQAEIDGIENRVRAGMRSTARQDPAGWSAMSQADRVAAGAEWARQQLVHEADLDRARKQLQIAKQIETTDRIQEALYADPENAHRKRARETIVKHDIEQTYVTAGAIKSDYMRQTMGAIDAMKVGQNFLARAFDVDNPAMERDIIREVYRGADGSTGNEVAKAAAEQIGKTTGAMRERFNRAGGNVGELDYGYVPIRHAQSKVLGNGSDAQRHAWADAVMPLLDRSQYLDDAGNPLNDAELRKVLVGEDREAWERANAAARGNVAPRKQGVWDTIAYGGVNKIVPGETSGGAARANAGSAHRVLHFRDADAHMQYNRQFGEGSLLNALVDHVGGMAKNIALVERYGPNPTRNMKTQMQLTAVHDGTEMRTLEGGMTSVGAYWNYVTGATNTPVNPALARKMETLRTTVSAVKLQGTILAALGDVGTMFVTAGYNKVPFFKTLGTAARLMAPGSKDFRSWLSSQGLIAESLEHGLNRWGTDNLATTWARNLSAATMKFGGVTGWTDALRTAFQSHMMRGLAGIGRTDWNSLTEWDRRALTRAGLTADDWAIVNKATPGKYGDAEYLTPDALYATGEARAADVVPKLLGMIREEGEFAVLNPDLRTKVIASATPGTVTGELKKSFMQFKSFPMAMISRHWGRIGDMRRSGDFRVDGAPALANPMAYAAALVVSTTLIGAISTQAKNLLAGKDPEPMFDDVKHAGGFWTRAFSVGGGAGFAGDMLVAAFQSADYGSLLGSAIGGPLLSTLFQPLRAVSSNVQDAAQGKDTHIGADLLKIAQSNTPLVNLWFWKTVWNRLIWDNLAENLSPGVTQRNMNRSRTQYHNDYFWSPGTGSPQRSPNLAAAVGGQ